MKCSLLWHPAARIWWTPVAFGLVFALVGLHSVQLFSPLRLNTDACRLLSMAVSAAEGEGFLVHGKSEMLPIGYPAAILLLMKLGAGTTFWLNALNLAALLATCGLVFLMTGGLENIRKRLGLRLALCALPLATWVSIKHVSIPVTESLYTGMSMASVAALIACWKSQRPAAVVSWLAIGVILAWCAMEVRTVGLSLFGASALTVAFHPRLRDVTARFRPKSARDWLRVAGISITGFALGLAALYLAKPAVVIPDDSYLRIQSDALQAGLDRFIGNTLSARFHEAGEIFLNIPATKFARLSFAFDFVGVVAIGIFALGWWRLNQVLPPLAFYMAFYCAILFCWPVYDVRFWMPLVPALGICVWLAVQPLLRSKSMRFGALAYLCTFLGLGFAALLFSVRISLAPPLRFAEIYGDGSYRASYRVAFGAEQIPSLAVNSDVVDLLRRFDARARL
jgi:hypothetical protein